MGKIDIKYIDVPNICFSLTDKNDYREQEYSEQRKTRGFDDSELWSLYSTISHFIYPRLKEFKENHGGYPMNLTDKKWDIALSKMVDAFELLCKDRFYNDEEYKTIDKGLKLFSKWYMDLWT